MVAVKQPIRAHDVVTATEQTRQPIVSIDPGIDDRDCLAFPGGQAVQIPNAPDSVDRHRVEL